MSKTRYVSVSPGQTDKLLLRGDAPVFMYSSSNVRDLDSGRTEQMLIVFAHGRQWEVGIDLLRRLNSDSLQRCTSSHWPSS